jgi:hypothetical protein
MAYRGMFDEFSTEIANSINDLTNYTHSLNAWSKVISSMSDRQKLHAAHEFIDATATVSLMLPYVIRSRFIFAIAHLCHQVNRLHKGKAWRDDLPLDPEIYLGTADKYGTGWRAYNPLKRRIEKINDKSYQVATQDFRTTYNHRFSPRVVIGVTRIITRHVDDKTKQVSYTFGGIPALTLEVVCELLSDQCKKSYAAFGAFQKLIREHEAAILEHQRRSA